MANLINFFAYAELMNPAVFKEAGFEAKAEFCVTLSSWKISFSKIPSDPEAPEGLGLCNIEPSSSNLGVVEGVLYEMDEKYLPKLDEYYQHPNEYKRKVMRFTRHDFTCVNGYVYVAPHEKVKAGLKPTKAMMKQLRGAKKKVQMLYFSRLMNTHTID